jgi:hypothetical protein
MCRSPDHRWTTSPFQSRSSISFGTGKCSIR